MLNPGDPGVDGGLFSESSCRPETAPRERSNWGSDLAAAQTEEEKEGEGPCAYHSAGEREGSGRLRRGGGGGGGGVGERRERSCVVSSGVMREAAAGVPGG